MTITAQDSTGRQEAIRNSEATERTQADKAQESFAPIIQDEKIRGLVKRFKLLSDETRLRILFYLANTDELHVRALCDLLSQSQPAVSHHLAMLRTAGVVEPRREGKHNFYRLLPGGFEQLLRIVFSDEPEFDDAQAGSVTEDGLRSDALQDGEQRENDGLITAQSETWSRPRPK